MRDFKREQERDVDTKETHTHTASRKKSASELERGFDMVNVNLWMFEVSYTIESVSVRTGLYAQIDQ